MSGQPAQLAVGIPRHPDGAPHAMTARCERFARQLEGRYRLPVARIDERYSSAVVERAADVDAAAAAVILQQWLDDGRTMLELDAEAIYQQLAQRAREHYRAQAIASGRCAHRRSLARRAAEAAN